MIQVNPIELVEALAAEYKPEPKKGQRDPAAKTNPNPPAAARPPSRDRQPGGMSVVERCRRYLAKVPPAVAGQHGHDRTYQAARIIWNDFGIDDGDGFPLLEEFNLTCDPKWDDADLRRKWDEAVKKGPGAEGRGYRAAERRPGGVRSTAPGGAGTGGGTPDAADEPPARPEIVHNGRQYRDVENDALAALILANDPPQVYVGNGCGLVDLVRTHDDSPLAARELEGPSLRPHLSRAANWFQVDGRGELVPDYPPAAVLSSVPVRGEWPGLPHLRAVVSYPMFGPGWVLCSAAGFHPASGIYCDLGDLVVPDAPARPTPEQVAAAKALILDELLGDFPFVDANHKTNAAAMLILPLIRHAIDGPTPLAVIDAPAEGTGKSLLAEVVSLATVGEIPDAISPDVPDEEWNKMLLALLIECQPVVYLDNANRKLDSASLASALTARFKKGRILGSTKTARARVNVSWILTANNVTCTREIARRIYWSRLDAGVEVPNDRAGFRHPDLTAWVRANRGRLIAAIITLVNHWLAAGRPDGVEVLGKFESWSKAVGGILAAAGIGGLLANAGEFRRACADQAGEMPEFVKAWWQTHNSRPVLASELFSIALECLESVLTAESEDGRRKQLGRFLRKQRDRVYGQFTVRAVLKEDGKEALDHSGRPRYRLESKGKKSDPRPTEDEDAFDIVG